ncbi:MAG: YbaK/EbsC family protein [Rhodospirillaceae bacterium]|nr:YbaK/EbsC family protein [Rhodospirillaceae bacterium]
MGMAITLKEYLKDCDIAFDVIEHDYEATSLNTANSAHIAGDCLAKGVLLRDDKSYTVAVLPSTHMIDLDKMRLCFDRNFELASEGEINVLFEDCDPGAVPPVGGAYGMKVLMDDALAGQPEIYFEAGDHRTLVHIKDQEFEKLMAAADHASFSHHI